MQMFAKVKQKYSVRVHMYSLLLRNRFPTMPPPTKKFRAESHARLGIRNAENILNIREKEEREKEMERYRAYEACVTDDFVLIKIRAHSRTRVSLRVNGGASITNEDIRSV